MPAASPQGRPTRINLNCWVGLFSIGIGAATVLNRESLTRIQNAKPEIRNKTESPNSNGSLFRRSNFEFRVLFVICHSRLVIRCVGYQPQIRRVAFAGTYPKA